MKTRLVTLMAVHNRKEKTLESLACLFRQSFAGHLDSEVVLLDDGSTDGTAEAVSQRFPWVQILKGDGNLYWNRGMHRAFAEAVQRDFDFYLWLNNDTLLYPDALQRLLDTSVQFNHQAIIVGSARDLLTGEHTYGGVVRSGRWHPIQYRPVKPGDKPARADTMNGNCVLIPKVVATAVGNLDRSFTHGIGDFDYGQRARKKGFGIWIAPGYCGTCSRNDVAGTWLDPALSFRARLKKVCQPKGLPPREWAIFTSRHAGVFWPVFWLSPYHRLLKK